MANYIFEGIYFKEKKMKKEVNHIILENQNLMEFIELVINGMEKDMIIILYMN